jgi:hypothetical protein
VTKKEQFFLLFHFKHVVESLLSLQRSFFQTQAARSSKPIMRLKTSGDGSETQHPTLHKETRHALLVLAAAFMPTQAQVRIYVSLPFYSHMHLFQ